VKILHKTLICYKNSASGAFLQTEAPLGHFLCQSSQELKIAFKMILANQSKAILFQVFIDYSSRGPFEDVTNQKPRCHAYPFISV